MIKTLGNGSSEDMQRKHSYLSPDKMARKEIGCTTACKVMKDSVQGSASFPLKTAQEECDYTTREGICI